MGYDAFAFNLPNFEQNSSGLWVRGQFGLKHLYADMIRFYVDQIPGEKILFSFSNPSAAAIEILAEKFQKNEAQSFKGLICDSGPSLAFVRSAWNLAIMSQRNPYLFASFSAFWSWKLHRDLPGQLATFPKDFPILSIRGTQDLIIPPWHIERVFENSGLPNVSTFELPEAGHLDGLKRFTDSYRKTLSQWLEQF